MKPIKAIMALLAAIIILPACNEEEWENLTYEQKVIETLLKQQKPKHDIGHELIDSMRYVILKTGIQLSPQEASAGLHFEPDPTNPFNSIFIGGDYFPEYYSDRTDYPTDTIGIIRNMNTLRRELKIADDQTLTYKGYEVLGIEDVTVEKGPIKHHIELTLYSKKDIPKVIEYVTSLGCRITSLVTYEEVETVWIKIALPLDRKAIPTSDEILNTKLKLQDVKIRPYFDYWDNLLI